jgi:hypothetical protein
MRGAIPPTLQYVFMARCLVRHRDNFIFYLKSVGKRPLEISRCRLEDNIRIDFREMEWEGVNWINLSQDRDQWRALVDTAMILRVP